MILIYKNPDKQLPEFVCDSDEVVAFNEHNGVYTIIVGKQDHSWIEVTADCYAKILKECGVKI